MSTNDYPELPAWLLNPHFMMCEKVYGLPNQGVTFTVDQVVEAGSCSESVCKLGFPGKS